MSPARSTSAPPGSVSGSSALSARRTWKSTSHSNGVDSRCVAVMLPRGLALSRSTTSMVGLATFLAIGISDSGLAHVCCRFSAARLVECVPKEYDCQGKEEMTVDIGIYMCLLDPATMSSDNAYPFVWSQRHEGTPTAHSSQHHSSKVQFTNESRNTKTMFYCRLVVQIRK